MEGHRGRMAMAMMIMMILSFSFMEMEVVMGRAPVLHRVGGGQFKWAPDVNFTQWTSQEVFYVGDWLYFGFDKHSYNVLQVNKTGYEFCAGDGYIANITRGGRDVFNLTEAQSYYFICTRSNGCLQGMKVAVSVTEGPEVNASLVPPRTLPRNDGSPLPSPLLVDGTDNDMHGPLLSAATFTFLTILLLC